MLSTELPISIIVYDMDQVLRDDQLHRSVREMTIAPFSGMNKALNSYIREMNERSIDAKAIIAYRQDSGEPVGWALYAWDPVTDPGRYDPGEGKICFQIFVHYFLRRHGIGSKLIKRANEIDTDKTLLVYRWNAIEFFDRSQDKGLNLQPIPSY